MKKRLALVLLFAGLLVPSATSLRAEDKSLPDAFGLSYAAEANGDWLGAVKALKTVETLGKGEYTYHLRLGWLNYVSGLYNESADCYNKAIALAPKAVEPLAGLLLPLQAAGKTDDMVRACQMILAVDPGNYNALTRLAWQTYLKKDYRKSVELYRKLVELYPADVEMLLGLGYAQKMSGDKTAADKTWQKVLIISPGNPRALEGMK